MSGWKACAEDMAQPSRHLKHLIAAPDRLESFSVKGSGLFFDYSRQRLDNATRGELVQLADALQLHQRFDRMCSGEMINATEKRAVLHTATRSFDDLPVRVADRDVLPDIVRAREDINSFSAKVHQGKITGSTGRPVLQSFHMFDFIGVRDPQCTQFRSISKGVTNHQELWANMLAQTTALTAGKDDPDAARHFTGNLPSSTIVLNDLNPRKIGRLLSFYEARTVSEGFIWGVNSFDQMGVQLGKTVASELRRRMAVRNRDKSLHFNDLDPISRFYLEMLMD